MKGIYLAACKARHNAYDLVYQDIDDQYNCDIGGNMLDINLSEYDYVVATPPCNWWSKVNMFWYKSVYAWSTVNLLPLTILKLSKESYNKPFIIENVINGKRFTNCGIYKLVEYLGLYIQEVGRHTYISNVKMDLNCPQHQDFRNGGIRINNDGYNQGGSNVHVVIEKWLDYIHSHYPLKKNGVLYE